MRRYRLKAEAVDRAKEAYINSDRSDSEIISAQAKIAQDQINDALKRGRAPGFGGYAGIGYDPFGGDWRFTIGVGAVWPLGWKVW